MSEPRNRLRVYLDTSVLGGAFDIEFAVLTRPFIDAVRGRAIRPVVSALMRDEVEAAPPNVLSLFTELRPVMELVDVTPDVIGLRDAYLDAGILTPKSRTDAAHVAAATISRCDMIVSWNFRHIVNARLMPLYNRVNTLRGHPPLAIHSPPEVVAHGPEEDI